MNNSIREKYLLHLNKKWIYLQNIKGILPYTQSKHYKIRTSEGIGSLAEGKYRSVKSIYVWETVV